MRTRIVATVAAVTATTAVVGMAGCGTTEPATVATESVTVISSSATATAPSVATSAAFVLRDGARASGPELVVVHRGDTVKFAVTADEIEQLHVHGYDKHVELQPGANEFQFVADIPGTFEVEVHSTETLVTKLRVR